MEIQIGRYAKPDDNYWEYLLCIRTTNQQHSPLTVIEQPDKKGNIKVMPYARVGDLMEAYPDNDGNKNIILHT